MIFFLMFLFWAKCKYKAKPFLFFPPTMGQQGRPSFCLAVQHVVVRDQRGTSTGWASGECLWSCPATSSLTLHTCLRRPLCSCQRQTLPGRKMASLDRACVKFAFLSLLYPSDSRGAVGYSVVFVLCYRETLLLQHFSSHFVQGYFFLSPAQASLLSSLWSG